MAPALKVRPAPERVLDPLWRLARDERTLGSLAALLLLLLLAPALLPQMPGQLRDDPASATRWLNSASAAWGPAGNALRTLGLLHVSSSPLLTLLTALLLFACLVQIADTLRFALAWRRLPSQLATLEPDAAAGFPVALARRRFLAPLDPALAAAKVEAHMREHYSAQAAAPGALDEGDSRAPLFVSSNGRLVWLRPLLPLGLLLALAGVWATAQFGWDVHVDALAPGETLTFAEHAVVLDWSGGQATAGEETVGGETGDGEAGSALQPLALAVGEDRLVVETVPTRLRAGGARVHVRSGPPALAIRGEGILIGRPGDDEPQAQLGVVFAEPGNEQFVLLPAQNAALRLLRLPEDEPVFLAEVYGPNAERPLSSTVISGTAIATLETAQEAVLLHIAPTSGLEVDIRRAPGLWLVIPGLTAAAAALLPLLRRPRFLHATVEPWPPPPAPPHAQIAAVTLQASERADVERAAAATGSAEAPASGSASLLPAQADAS